MNDSEKKVQRIKDGIALMVQRQHTMNCKVDANWHERSFPFYRAAWTELGEAMQYLDWEWWKKVGEGYGEYKDLNSFGYYCLEVVDALHFVTSMHIQEVLGAGSYTDDAENKLKNALLDKSARVLGDYLTDPSTPSYASLFYGETSVITLPSLTEDAALCCLYKLPRNAYSYLVSIGCKVGIGFAGLLAFYVGKNVLNVFRQDNGYKEGTYLKVWDSDGEEDNLYLAQAILGWLGPQTEDGVFEGIFSGRFETEITETLQMRYNLLTGASIV